MTHAKWYFLTLLLIIADQLTKLLIYGYIKPHESLEITHFFSLTHVHNYGAAFSFLANEDGWQQYFLVAVSSIASLAIIVWMMKTSKQQVLKLVALSLILSGAVGNLIDRAALGFVIDFIDLHYQDFYWPVFNIADITISVGVVLLILADFKNDKRLKNE
ncbi:Lipoprotein signal peptidase [Bathymodiolus heckerae thiotrophic gill symbiont]|uniref:signal peptidase II n=1 Tax=Bathymodiolus heckerae thiotrophic gill symbiont TaxID=1052212 RepID=UPI0010BB7EA8|nr:signal peptidase II [Bathymodiolus heckerae thiotrophic gill symbiont]SHN91711.1 Lipoprotein signal peptidase [Bathymodiolus heckerae thiotrophic gill symbiont]